MSNLILVCGESTKGKTTCLEGLKDQEGIVYLNTETNKELTFPNKFKKMKVTHYSQVSAAIQQIEAMPDVHTIIIDSLTFWMKMCEMQIVGAAPPNATMQAWGTYGDTIQELFLTTIPNSTKTFIITAHVVTEISEKTAEEETFVKVKGATKITGIEAFFSNIVMCDVVTIAALQPFVTENNKLLNISEDDEIDGVKYVIQTRKTKTTRGNRVRSGRGQWHRDETYIDGNIQSVLDRIRDFHTV